MSLTMVGLFSLIFLCLPFGGAYCPCVWCMLRELTCDLANALLRCDYWHAKKMDFNNKSAIPEPKMKDNAQELAKVLPEDVLVDPEKGQKCSTASMILFKSEFSPNCGTD